MMRPDATDTFAAMPAPAGRTDARARMIRAPKSFDLDTLIQSRLRFAVVGICHWHADYYREILNSVGLDLVGATDSDRAGGSAKAEAWGIPFSADLEGMIRHRRPDFLFVLPRHDRAPGEIALAAASGLPFLVEKPLGLDAAGASLAAEAVARAGAFADVCLPLRHTGIWAAFDQIHRLWSPQDLSYAHFRTINGPPERYTTYGVPWMLDPQQSGGGALRNLGFHGVDAALALAGGAANLTVEGAALIRRPGDKVERFATATLRTADGALITLEAGYAIAAPAGSDQEWRISTDRAFLCQRDSGLTVQQQGDASPRVHARDRLAPYARMLANSVGAFVSGLDPTATIHEAVEAALLVDRIYASADPGRGDLE